MITRISAATLAAALLIGPLTACASPEERLRADSATCSAMGFPEKTEAFSHCLLDMELARRSQNVVPRRR